MITNIIKKERHRLVSLMLVFLLLINFLVPGIASQAKTENVSYGSIISTDNDTNIFPIKEIDFPNTIQENTNEGNNISVLENTSVLSVENNLFSYEKTDEGLFITGFKDDKITNLIIPGSIDGIKVIGIKDLAFKDANIESVEIGPNVKYIGDYAFSDNKIETIVLKDVEHIGIGAFMNNNINAINVDDVKKIGDYAFKNNNLKTVHLSDDIIIGQGVFTYNKQVVEIIGNNNLTDYSNGPEYGHASNLTTIIVEHKDMLTGEKIANDLVVGDDLTDVNNIVVKGDVFNYKPNKLNGYELVNDTIDIIANDNTKVEVFYNKQIVDITIDVNVPPTIAVGEIINESILLSYAKAYNNKGDDLTNKITVTPSTLDTSIMNSIKQITYTVIDDLGNQQSKIVDFHIGMDWLKYPTGNGWVLGDFTYGSKEDGKENIVTGLSKTGLEKIKTNKVVYLPTINPYNRDVVIDTVSVENKNIENNVFKDAIEIHGKTIKKVDDYSFVNSLLTNIDLPNVKYVGDFAFTNSNIKQLDLYNVEYIGNSAFGHLDGDNVVGSKVEILNAPKVKVLGDYSFINSNIKDLKLLELERTGEYTFGYIDKDNNEYGSKIENLYAPKLEHIGMGSFVLSRLTNIDLPNVKYIDDRAFGRVRNGIIYGSPLKTANMPQVEYIGRFAFMNGNISSLYLPEVKKIDDYAFGNKVNGKVVGNQVKELYVPKVEYIGLYNFANSDVKTLDAPELKELANYAFSGPSKDNKGDDIVVGAPLIKVSLPKLEIAGEYAMANNKLTSLELPNLIIAKEKSFSAIYGGLVYGGKIEDLIAPKLKEVGRHAFLNSNIKHLDLPEIEIIGPSAFGTVSSGITYGSPVETLNAPKLKRIENFGLRAALLTKLDLPSLEYVGSNALADAPIEEYNIPNIVEIGRRAFVAHQANSMTVSDSLEKIDITAFGDSVVGSSKKLINISILNKDGEPVNPHKVTNGPYHIINSRNAKPQKVINIKYVDTNGNVLKDKNGKNMPIERVMVDDIYKPKYLIGYRALKDEVNVTNIKTGSTIEIPYEKYDLSKIKTSGITLRQDYGQGNKSEFYIGNNMINRVSLALTGFTKELKNPRVRIFYGDAFDCTNMSVGKNELVVGTIKGDNYIDVLLNKNNIGGANFEFILKDFKFKENVTPSDIEESMLAVLFDGDKPVHSGNELVYRGYYKDPILSVGAYDAYIDDPLMYGNNGSRDFGTMERIPKTTIERVGIAKPVRYVFRTDNYKGPTLERNVSNYTIKVKLPTYTKVNDDGSVIESLAVFDESINEGWVLDTKTNTAIYVSEEFKGTISPIYPELNLLYPHIKNSSNVRLESEIEFTPEMQGVNESTIKVKDRINNYPTDITKIYPTGEHHFHVDHMEKPNTRNEDAFIFDIQEDREKIIPYQLVMHSRNNVMQLDNVVLTAYNLDDRLYHHSVVIPKIDDIDIKVVAYKKTSKYIDPENDIFVEGHMVNAKDVSQVVFEDNEFDYYQIIFPEDFVMHKQIKITANTKLKNPDDNHFELGNNQLYFNSVMSSRNTIKSSGKLSGERGDLINKETGNNDMISEYLDIFDKMPGNFFWNDKNIVNIEEVSNNVSLEKMQEFYNVSADGSVKTVSGQGKVVNGSSEGKYTLKLKPFEDRMFDDYKDFIMIDYMPNELNVLDYKLSKDFLNNSINPKIELIDNYEKTGQKAIVVTADRLGKDVKVIATIDVVIKDEIQDGVTITNNAKASWSNSHIYKDGMEDRQWTEDSKYIQVIDGKMVMAKKEIRNIDGPWRKSIITDSKEPFDYKLSVINKSGKDTANVEFVDVFPYKDDVGIQELSPGKGDRVDRESEFSNTLDINRQVIVPKGYTVEYYNGPVIDYNNKSADDVFNGLKWSTTPSINTKAIRVKANPGVILKDGEKLDVIIPMRAPDNDDLSLVGKKAYNTFVRKDNASNRLLEPNRVYNEMLAPKGSVEIIKHGRLGFLSNILPSKPLEGAEFVIVNDEGVIIDKKTSGKDGKILFENIPLGPNYTIYEINAPSGYLKSDNELLITLKDFINNRDNDYHISKDTKDLFLNREPYKGYLELEKRDNKGELIPNISFSIKGIDSHNKDTIITKSTDSKGYLKIDNIIEGKYELIENSKEIGLYLDKKVVFDIDKDGKVIDFTGDKSIVNSKAMVRINKLSVNSDFNLGNIDNIDSWKYQKLSGYAFDIKDSKGNIKTVKTDSNGTLTTSLNINEVYTIKENLKESIKDKDHAFNINEYAFKINSKGHVVGLDNNEFVENAVNIPNPETPIKGQVKIKKVSNYGELLEGVEFGLYQKDKLMYKGTTDNKGELTISDIEQGLYTLKELKTKDGFLNNFKDKTILIDKNPSHEYNMIEKDTHTIKEISLTVVNPKIEIDFVKGSTIAITDINTAKSMVSDNNTLKYELLPGQQARVYKPLANVIFNVRVNDVDKGNYTTNNEGKLNLSDLVISEDDIVTIKELQTLDDYVLHINPIVINVKCYKIQEGFNGTISYFFNNKEKEGSISVSKADKHSKKALEGVEFTLYKDSVDERNIVDVKYTDKSGFILFDKLKINQKYILKETKSLDAYKIPETLYEFTPTSQSLSKSFVVYNELKEPENINITLRKLDGQTKEPLEDVIFTLYKNGNKVIDATSNQDGIVQFAQIPYPKNDEEYTIKETKTLKGYRLLNKDIVVNLDTLDGDTISLGDILNYKSITSLPDTGTIDMLILSLLILIVYIYIDKKELYCNSK